MKNTGRVNFEKHRALLKDKLQQLMPETGDYPSAVKGLALYRRHGATDPKPVMYKPVIVVIFQGGKYVRIGADEYIYGQSSYFVAGVDMPASSAMLDSSPGKPFLSLALDLDKSLIAQIAAEVPPAPAKPGPARGAMVAAIDCELLDAFLRLLELLEKPEQISLLSPLIIKEIHYRLLAGPFGRRLRDICTQGTADNQISRAVGWLRDNFDQALSVDELARQANMAVSTFHKHFKEITALSPLQYQKRLRLEEARRLMLSLDYDASRASQTVGYESLPQFTREYKRLFGDPPRRDVIRMKGALDRFGETAVP